MSIKRALIAVSDKTGVCELASALAARGIEILSTGGTARTLRESGIRVREVADVTGFPEIFGGRVKTLHPRIHGGLLARRDLPEDRRVAEEQGIPMIDLLIVNLYPFERTVATAGVRWEQAIEEIDIGGPAMIRAAAKNHAHVAVIVDPAQYPKLLHELEEHQGAVCEKARRKFALEALRRTAAYDAAISNWMGREIDGEFPKAWTEQWRRVDVLRYGENPHQKAAWYRRADAGAWSLPDARLSGEKALSYNNLLDAGAAIDCVGALARPAAVIVKHCLPCGAAERENVELAFGAALAGDPLSAYGGILALNDTLTVALAKRLASPDLFFEVIHAPAIEPGAEEIFRTGVKWGKNCRLLIGGAATAAHVPPWEARTVPGVMLIQERDRLARVRADFQVVSARKPTDGEWANLEFAWRTIPVVRSNAILLARDNMVVGVGAGQPSRVDAVAIACRKAGERARGAVLASDAFFPFADGIEEAAKAGVVAAIQPGGSVRDREVIAGADRHGMAMVFTGERHFKH